ncbi:hypothetical protein MTO96_033024 [Rhipicephalus appendiculatus]
MRREWSSRHLPQTPVGAGSRVSLDLQGHEESDLASPRHAGSSSFQEDAADLRHELETGSSSRASLTAGTSTVAAAGTPSTTEAQAGAGARPVSGGSGWASAFSKEAICVLGIVVALCFLLVALVYLNLSHRAGM